MKFIEKLPLFENFEPDRDENSSILYKAQNIKNLHENETFDLPTFVDIRNQMKDNKFPTLGVIKDTEEKRAIEDPVQVKKETEEENKVDQKKEQQDQKEPIKFVTDLGRKAILFNDAFKNIDEQGKAAVSDMFSEEEIKKILNEKSLEEWQKVNREPILCVKTHLENDKFSKIRCYNEKIQKFGFIIRKYILSCYKRMDDIDKKAHNIEDPFFKKMKVVSYVPMQSSHPQEEIAILPVSKIKTAMVLHWSRNDEPYLFNITPFELNFYFSTK